MRPEAGLSGLSAPPVFELRLGEQKRRVFYAEIYPCGVLDFSQSGKPCPGGITVEQGGKERDLITWGSLQANARRCQRVIGAAEARKIRQRYVRPAEGAVDVQCGKIANEEFGIRPQLTDADRCHAPKSTCSAQAS